MNMTKEQLKELKEYEQHFITAMRSDYARYPGQHAVKRIHEIYCEATGKVSVLNASCSSCVLRLLKECGKIYFDTLEQQKKRKKS